MPPPPLRVLPALLLLLLLFVTAPPPHCSASVSTNSSSVATRIEAVPAASNRGLPTILHCYPGLILYDSNRKYQCKVSDSRPMENMRACTIHTTNAFNGCVWPATASNNLVTFTAGDGWSTSGVVSLSFGVRADMYTSAQTQRRSFLFFRYTDTTSSITVPNPYYGMTMIVEANFPREQPFSRRVLIDPREECPVMIQQCRTENRCYDVTDGLLPPPGTYKLCLSGKGWDDYLLRWGTARVTVSPLVATPLYLSNRVVPPVKLHNGDTSAVVWPRNTRMYLVRCATGTCPSVRSLRGDPMVAKAACDETANRVEILSTPLTAPAGTYALCVVDEYGGSSPATFPITVLQDPFTMEVAKASRRSVTLRVSGGDLATRTEPYEVCIAENGASCATLTSRSECTKSSSPNAETVDVDVRRVEEKGNINFCLVTRMEAYNGQIYAEISLATSHMVVNEGDGEESLSQQGGEVPVWLVVLIVLGCVSVVSGVILAVCCWRRRKARIEEESPADKDQSVEDSMSPSSHSFAVSITGEQQSNTSGDQLPAEHIPSEHSSFYSLRSDSQGGVSHETVYGNWMQH